MRIGFSWPAFFLGLFGLSILWLALKRLWRYVGIWLGAYVAWSAIYLWTRLVSAEPGVRIGVYAFFIAANICLWLLPAFRGYAWRLARLKEHGYEAVGRVQAASREAALEQVLFCQARASEA